MTQAIQMHQNIVLSSPLPGKIVEILVREGDIVERGQRAFIVESMKMLHELRAANHGRMTNITVKKGDVVAPQNHLAYIQSRSY